MAGNPTSKNLIAVVIGAVLLFGAISVIPIVIMRRHRRKAAERHANELRRLQVNGSMRQVTVRRWLDQQTRSDNLERYADESCPICLTSLFPVAPSALSLSGSTIHTLTPNQPNRPEAAHISPSHHHHHLDLETCRSPIPSQTNNDDDNRTRLAQGSHNHSCCPSLNLSPSPSLSRGPNTLETRSNIRDSLSGVLILNRCSHAFHTACLASWFQYRQYRCPICSDVLFAE